MSNNYLVNYGAPTVDNIGQLTILMDTTLVHSINSVMPDELVSDILSSGGMTGQKYRSLAFKKVALTLMSEAGTAFTAKNDVTKRAWVSVVMVAIGLLLGTTASKRTLTRTIGGIMDARTNQEDSLGLAWRVIKAGFRTYVNEPSADQTLFPSLKYCSSCPEFALMGVMILATRTFTVVQLAVELARPFVEWPELFRKQWIGNFALDPDFQMEHMAWERVFWSSDVASSNNAANKNFVKKFNPNFYKTTIDDKYLVMLADGSLLVPANAGYTKSSFARAMLILAGQVIAGRATTYMVGSSIINTNTNTNAVAPANRFVRIANWPAINALNAAQNTALNAITATPAPAELTASTDAEVTSVVASVRSSTFVPP